MKARKRDVHKGTGNGSCASDAPDLVPTKDELEVLAHYHAMTILDLWYSQNVYGISRRGDRTTTQHSYSRLERIAGILGADVTERFLGRELAKRQNPDAARLAFQRSLEQARDTE